MLIYTESGGSEETGCQQCFGRALAGAFWRKSQSRYRRWKYEWADNPLLSIRKSQRTEVKRLMVGYKQDKWDMSQHPMGITFHRYHTAQQKERHVARF